MGQIDKAVANYRSLLEKHAHEFDSETVQYVLSQPELTQDQFMVFRKRVEIVSKMVVRTVKVNRTLEAQTALDATGRRQYTVKDVVNAMPRDEGEEVEVVFFNLGRYVSNADLENEYELRVLRPIDPYALAAVNEADPASLTIIQTSLIGRILIASGTLPCSFGVRRA